MADILTGGSGTRRQKQSAIAFGTVPKDHVRGLVAQAHMACDGRIRRPDDPPVIIERDHFLPLMTITSHRSWNPELSKSRLIILRRQDQGLLNSTRRPYRPWRSRYLIIGWAHHASAPGVQRSYAAQPIPERRQVRILGHQSFPKGSTTNCSQHPQVWDHNH